MLLFVLVYWWVLIPILILYIISFITTLKILVKKGKTTGKIKLIAHLITLSAIIGFNLYESDVFKSKRVMTAVLKDDQYHYRLIFRENGVVENHINGLFGYTETIIGNYHIKDHLIIFNKKPYDNEFIPDTLLIDKKQNALFLNKDKAGNFSTKKEWLNFFEIEEY